MALYNMAYQNQGNDNFNYYYTQPMSPYVKPNVCPGCGQCNTCGRPAPRPWPYQTGPYWYSTQGKTTSVSTFNVK